MSDERKAVVVVVGGGFAGLSAARALNNANIEVTLVDRRNAHVFQPLLYQVATGGLSPGDIASPLRAVLRRHENTRVLMAPAEHIDPDRKEVWLASGAIGYDYLILAAGASIHYFGHREWAPFALGLKTFEDALAMRTHILNAFEQAELACDQEERQAWTRIVIVGGGPTGIELAGALAELVHGTLAQEFRAFDPTTAEIHLIEAGPRILPSFSESLARRAEGTLRRMGVIVSISTAGAQREMVLPSLLAILLPIVTGLVLGVGGVVGLLTGGLATGFALACMLNNSGGAWDNAKKYIEKGHHGGKGSDAHKAAVVGDTVGDPFKDTAGPSLNILIKLMSMVAVVFAGVVVRYWPTVAGILGVHK